MISLFEHGNIQLKVSFGLVKLWQDRRNCSFCGEWNKENRLWKPENELKLQQKITRGNLLTLKETHIKTGRPILTLWDLPFSLTRFSGKGKSNGWNGPSSQSTVQLYRRPA
jgi:hypothetical protein